MAVDSDVEIISNDEEVDEVIDDTEIKYVFPACFNDLTAIPYHPFKGDD
jgi:hypothetical protein